MLKQTTEELKMVLCPFSTSELYETTRVCNETNQIFREVIERFNEENRVAKFPYEKLSEMLYKEIFETARNEILKEFDLDIEEECGYVFYKYPLNKPSKILATRGSEKIFVSYMNHHAKRNEFNYDGLDIKTKFFLKDQNLDKIFFKKETEE